MGNNFIKKYLLEINYKMLVALVVLGFAPTLYTTLRVYFLGTFPETYQYSIAGQLTWVNLIFEVLDEAIILPLYFSIGSVILDEQEFKNRIKTGFTSSFIIYSILAILVIMTIQPLFDFMKVPIELFELSKNYIRLEVIANVFKILTRFGLVVLLSINKDKYFYVYTIVSLLLSILLDTFLVSNTKFSLKLGVNGIAYSNIISNLLLLVAILFIIIKKEKINFIREGKYSDLFIKEYSRGALLSGIESFVRNLFYMVMVSRMVNVVNEQGTYWVANNFIWGWLLLVVNQLAELIKRDMAENRENIKKKTIGYFLITMSICIIWVILIPLYKPFMKFVLNYDEVEKLYNLILLLLIPYMFYAFQNIFDAEFYGLGKIKYLVFETIVTNIVYYGLFFVLYKFNIFIPTLTSIALMFGGGLVFDSFVSCGAYVYMIKKDVLK